MKYFGVYLRKGLENLAGKFFELLESVGIEPWIFTGLIGLMWTYYLFKDSIKEWKNLTFLSKNNFIMMLMCSVFLIVMGILKLLHIISGN